MTPSPKTDDGFAGTILRKIPGMSSPKVPGSPTGFPTGCACRVTTGFPTPQGRGEPHGHPWKRPVDDPWMWPQGCAPQGKCCGVGRACCTLLRRFIEIFYFLLVCPGKTKYGKRSPLRRSSAADRLRPEPDETVKRADSPQGRPSSADEVKTPPLRFCRNFQIPGHPYSFPSEYNPPLSC